MTFELATDEELEIADILRCRKKFDRAQAYVLLPDKGATPPKPAHEFYASFMQRLRYTESDKVPLAGVAFRPETSQGTLYINRENCEDMLLAAYAGMVVHEIGHVAKDHVYYEEAFKDPYFWNLVADCEVNHMAEKVLGYLLPWGHQLKDKWAKGMDPKKGVQLITVDSLSKMLDVEPPRDDKGQVLYDKPAIWYYRYFKKAVKDRAKEKGETQTCPVCQGSGQAQPSGDGESQQGGEGDPGGSLPKGPENASGSAPGDSLDNASDGKPPSSENTSGAPLDSTGNGSPGSGPGHQHGPVGEPCPCCGGDGEATADEIARYLSDRIGHDVWKEMQDLPSDLRDLTRQYAAQLFDDVVRECPSGCPGNLTHDYEQAVKILRREVSWISKTDHWYGKAGTFTPSINPRRFNKRDRLGRATLKPQHAVWAILDVSGSVENPEFGAFMGVNVQLMERNDSAVYAIEIDVEIKDEYLLNDVGVKDEYVRHGSGGTILTAAFERVAELEESGEFRGGGLIVFTDGGLFEWPHPDLVPDNTLWVITDREAKVPNHMPGEVVYFDINVKA